MFSVLVLEDNLIQSNIIKQLIIEKYPRWDIYIAKGYMEAKNLLDKYKFGMFLIDIELSDNKLEPDGLDFGRMIRGMPDYKYAPVLFLARFTDKVFTAVQDVHCCSYLVKPCSQEQLTEAVDYAAGMVHGEAEVLLLRDASGVYQRVVPLDIEYLETSGKNIIIHTNTSTIAIANYTVNKILGILPEYFARCHKRFIINKKKMLSYDKSTQIMRLGRNNIPVGRKYKEDLERFLDL